MNIYKMFRLVFSGLLLSTLLLSQATHADTLSASVDRDTLSLQETFTLTLRFYAQTGESPDLSLLQTDFDILNTQQSNQMRVVNGSMESFVDWRISLAPKRVGTLRIPSFTIEGAKSDPITITIESQNTEPKNTDTNVFVDLKVDKDAVYVQEQVLLTIRLYTAVNLNGAELQPLEIPDALVVNLGETQFQTTLNGRRHVVVETSYSVYPQHSGELTIPSLAYNVSMSTGQRGILGGFYGGQSNNVLRLRTEEQKISVKTAPDSFNAQTWLPAANVEILEHWSSDVQRLKVGEPVTRTITIKANELTADQISPLAETAIDGLTFYPDQAQTDDQKTPRGVVGSRIETFAIIPSRSGEFTLPPINIKWWDTANNKMQTAVLPAKVIQVADTVESLNQAAAQPEPEISLEPVPINTELEDIPATEVRMRSPLWLSALAGVLGLLAIIFAYLYWRARQELAAIYDLQHEDKTNETHSENEALSQLKRACESKNYPAIRQAVLHWAQAHWKDPNIQSLQTIAERANSEPLNKQLKELDAALYRNDERSGWNTKDLLAEIEKVRKQKRSAADKKSGLAPLYK